MNSFYLWDTSNLMAKSFHILVFQMYYIVIYVLGLGQSLKIYIRTFTIDILFVLKSIMIPTNQFNIQIQLS